MTSSEFFWHSTELETEEPRGPFMCGEFYIYRMASGWAVLNDHYEPPDVYGLKSCAHALQWIYDYRMERLRDGKA